jgi:hypothetical protein
LLRFTASPKKPSAGLALLNVLLRLQQLPHLYRPWLLKKIFDSGGAADPAEARTSILLANGQKMHQQAANCPPLWTSP